MKTILFSKEISEIYNSLDDDFHNSVPFREYVDMMNTLMPKQEYRREHEMSGRELKNKNLARERL